MRWQDHAFHSKSRLREDIEWSTTYTFNALDSSLPRVLLIGDSICAGYQDAVRKMLDGKVNVSYWATSKCVTDRDYVRELDFILDSYKYDIITFNNGLHSLKSDRAEWDEAYGLVIEYIQKKLPNVKLSLTLSTPLKDAKLTAISASLNETVLRLAAEKQLPVIDLFTAMDELDREINWSDTYHFQSSAKEIQGNVISTHVLKQLKII